MAATKKYYPFKVTAEILVKVFGRSAMVKRKDIQIMVVPENSSQAAGKKYVLMINKRVSAKLDRIIKIEKI